MQSGSDTVNQARWRGHALLLAIVILALGSGGRCMAQSTPVSASAADVLREPALSQDEENRLKPASGTTELNLNQASLPLAAERRRLSSLRETLSPIPEAAAQLRIKALEGFIDYDEDDQMIYAPGRTRIEYGRYYLEADKVILDARLKEAQAEGNVILKIQDDTIHATSLRYNFDSGEGVGFGVSGGHDPIYFQAAKPKKGEEHIPQLQRVSKQESIFRNTNVTTCDFKVPHYYLRGREVVLYQNDKIFFRGATIYVMNAPVMYLPFVSRSLKEASPWFMSLGYGSRTGARIRLGYRYRHVVQEPSLTDDDEYETRQSDVADTYVDYLSKKGLGTGMDYKYNWDFGKHRGELNVYGLEPFGDDRNVVKGHEDLDSNGKQKVYSDDDERWMVDWKHRTKLTDRVNLMFNVNEFSDPDLFYDALDYFSDDNDEQQRQMTRRARGELTYRNDAFTARVYGEAKDRITIDKYFDNSNPTDNDRQWDLNPYGKLKGKDLDGYDTDRWGRVSEKLQADIMTRMLPIGLRPWYYSAELHTYYNMDKGFNWLKSDDDASVPGTEFYQRVTRQWKLSPRYTFIAAAGFGAGATDRETDGFGGNYPDSGTFPQKLDSLSFVDDKGTFLVGKRKMNYDQIQNAYMWGDASAKFVARFTDALTGTAEWDYRKTTDDFLGDWYAKTGDTTFREDLYDYKLRENWIKGDLNYRLARPVLTLFLRLGQNLESQQDLFPNEEIAYAYTGYNWSNQRHTLVNSGSAGWRQRQILDPTDPDEMQQDKIFLNEGLSYSPIHQRWYASVIGNYSKALNGTVERSSSADYTYFSDEDPDGNVKVTYGRELGPKWNTEIYTNWDEEVSGFKQVSWVLKRDLHDATGVVKLTLKDKGNSDSRNDSGDRETDVRFGIKYKLPNRDLALGAGDVRTAKDRAHEPALAY